MSLSSPSLQSSWTACLSALGCSPALAQQAFADVVHHYAQPERHYHTLAHIHAMLAVLHRLQPEAFGNPALLLAVWLHDVIYAPQASDNEARSAEYARKALTRLDVPEPVVAETERLIRLTQSHQPGAEDTLGQVLIDADLAILGASPAEYDHYAEAIRREYSWVAETAYRQGRSRVLQTFLDRPLLYATPPFRAEMEEPARRNLQRELAALQAT